MSSGRGVVSRLLVKGALAGIAAILALSLAASFGGAGAEESEKDVVLNPSDAFEPDTVIDLGVSTFKGAVDRFAPRELPIRVPGLDGLGPVTIDAATLTVVRPTDPFQSGGWIVRIVGGAELELAGGATGVEVEIELEWEDEEGDHTPVVTLRSQTTGPVTVEQVLALGGLLQAEAAAAETVATTTSVSDVALAFRWDGDGPSPRSWFDVTGKVTVGDRNLSLQFLLSGDQGAPKGDYVIAALRLDSTVEGADRVTLSELVNGPWGSIAGELDLPEFVVARVSGLEEGTTLGRMDLRVKSAQLAFFAGCDDCTTALPEDLELDTSLTLLAKIDLAAFGPVVADAFGYPQGDSVVDLYGRLGVTFSSVGDDDPVQLDQVSLRARVPESGGVNALLPDWLELGAWTLTMDYDADPLVGGITVGATTEVRIELDDGADGAEFIFDPTVATFTRTSDGTISVGVAAESNARWDAAFGLDWLDLTNLGLGFSYTAATNGQTAFDAAITSTYELHVPGRTDPTIGRLEARLGVTDDVQVSLRVAFGEDGSDVPIGAVLAAVSDALGAAPELTGELGELVLDDLRFAISVRSDGTVTFETFASAYLPMFGDVTGYLFVETGDPLRFFFGIRPTGATSLGELMSPPGGDGPPPHEVLSGIQLPMLGVIAAPVGGFEAASRDLTPDGFEFFAPLHGCTTTAPECSPFEVDLEAGVNLVANIAFPGELQTLAEELWIDATSGLQFRGTLALPGLFDPGGDVQVKLGLRLTLPRLDPRDAVEFLEDGALTLGVEAVLGSDPRIALFVEGELNTRWRRGDEPLAPGGSCSYRSVPLPQFEDAAANQENPTWCYDRLTFIVRSELSLSTAGFSVSFLGGLSAPEGWQHPFGVPGFEWLVVNDLVLKLEVSFPAPTGGIAITAGFLGDVEIDNGDPDRTNTVLRASLAAGATIQQIPGPPGVSVIPNFKGVRASVSRIGVSDVVALQRALFPDGVGDVDLDAVPDVEFRDVEFMFAIGSDADLCLEPRIGFAGAMWIDPITTGGGGEDRTGPCVPFGEHVDASACIAARNDGCVASVKATIGLDGIVAQGALGNFALGPVTWQDSIVDVQLRLGAAPVIAVSGGVAVDGLGDGGLAVRVEALPPKIEFFGYVTAFEAFEVQLGGSAAVGVDPLWPPRLNSDLTFRAALRAEFDQFLRDAVATELDRIARQLDALDAALQLLVEDPIRNLPAARDALEAAGVVVPDWFSALIDLVGDVGDILPSGAAMPTVQQILAGADLEFRFEAQRSCGWLQYYDSGTDTCRWVLSGATTDTEPTPWCVFPGELDTSTNECVYLVPIAELIDGLTADLPANWVDALAEVHAAVVDAITRIDLVPSISGLGITDYLRDLSAQLADARFLSVECASFDWRAGQGAGEIDVAVLLHVLGEPYGFEVELDLTDPTAGVRSLVEALTRVFLTGDPATAPCTSEQEAPAWLTATGVGDGATVRAITLDPVGPVDEGDEVTVTGRLSPPVPIDDPVAVTVTWGDGATTVLDGVTGETFTASHVYPDDDPSGTPQDPYAVRASTPGAFGAAERTLVVRNVAPNGLALWTTGEDDELVELTEDAADTTVDEGRAFHLVGTFRDPGVRDTHAVSISWGDGTATRVGADQVTHLGGGEWRFDATHVYVDDDPTATPSDPARIAVSVVDDDRGRVDLTRRVTIANVAPGDVTVTALIGGDGQPPRVDEGVAVTYRITWSDPGERDTFLVTVDFGEPDQPTVVRRATRGRTLDVTHVYRDDDPTDTAMDVHTISVVVTDDDAGAGHGSVDVEVHNVAPVVTVGGPAEAVQYTEGDAVVRVQYSDPIGGRVIRDNDGQVVDAVVDPFTITATDVADDTLTLTTELAQVHDDGTTTPITGFPSWLHLSGPICEPSGTYHQDCRWTVDAQVPGTAPYVHTDLAPGTYDLVFTVTDDDTGVGTATLRLVVEPEDARVWYVGPTYAATTSARDGWADVELRSTIRDITSAVATTDPAWDPWPGDVRLATMAFVDRDANDTTACATATIDEVVVPLDPFVPERSIGIGACSWRADIGGADAASFEIGTVVAGRYTRDHDTDDTVITVARPLEDFITGGGHLVLADSSGVFAGAEGSVANFGFHVKFNKRLTNLQGGVTLLVRASDGTLYRVRSNAMDSLGIDRDGAAQFESKANVAAVTEDGTTSVGGNYVLQMTLADRSDDGSADTIGLTLWDVQRKGGTGPNATTTRTLLFSSSWDGNRTVERALSGGNLLVHYR